MREEQRRALDVPGTGMAVTLDLDNANDIHPPNKIDVAERLARWPLARLYGKKISFSGPLFRAAKLQDGSMVTTFDHVDTGLTAGRVLGPGNFQLEKGGG